MTHECRAGIGVVSFCLAVIGTASGEDLDSLVGRVEAQAAKISQYRADAEVVEAFG